MTDIISNAKDIRPLLGANLSRIKMGVDAEIGNTIFVNNADEAALTSAATLATLAGNIGLIVGCEGLNRADGTVKIGEWVSVCWQGRVALNTGDLDPSKKLFVSNTAGKLADAAGTNSRVVGAPLSKNEIFFDGIVK